MSTADPGPSGPWDRPDGPPHEWAPPPAPSPPARRPRTGRVLALVGGALVVGLVAAAVLVVVTRDDAEPGLGTGPTSEPEVAWRTVFEADGEDVVRVVADGERVYTLVSRRDGSDDLVGMLSARTADGGELLWEVELDPGTMEADPFPLGDAIVVLEAFDGAASSRLLDAATGEEVWRADGFVAGGYATDEPTQGTSVLDADPILLTDVEGDDEGVAAVDRATGEVVWAANGATVRPCGSIAVIGDEALYGDEDSTVVARTLDDGEERWRTTGTLGTCDRRGIAVSPSPREITYLDLDTGDEVAALDVPDGETMWVGLPFGDDHLAAYRTTYDEDTEEETTTSVIHPLDGGDPTWESEDGIAVPVAPDRAIVQGEDELSVVRARDGEELATREYARLPSCPFGSVVVLACPEGASTVTAFTLADLEELWSIDVDGVVRGAAVGGEMLFVLTADRELLAFG